MIFPIYIGYDRNEAIAYQVCAYSIQANSSIPIHISKLSWDTTGYARESFLIDGPKGIKQWIDWVDGTPFSTAFSFARFMVPILRKEGWALFLDCDFLVQEDVGELLKLADKRYAVMVVKHNHRPREAYKMGGLEQTSYERKNWSSFVLWNCEHPGNKYLTLADVNTKPGWWLHGFHWLRDSEIGELPLEWNYLVGYYPKTPKALHYTLGGPWCQGANCTDFFEDWLTAKKNMEANAAIQDTTE